MPGEDPLGLDPETMRALGYRTVDALVDWLIDADARPLGRASPQEMRERLGWIQRFSYRPTLVAGEEIIAGQFWEPTPAAAPAKAPARPGAIPRKSK